MSKSECMNVFQWTAHKLKDKLSRKKVEKESVYGENVSSEPSGVEITTIAVVLDDEVQEVIKAEGRLAALLLSEPKFIEVDPNLPRPTIGWSYKNNKFKPPVQDIKIEDAPQKVDANEI